MKDFDDLIKERFPELSASSGEWDKKFHDDSFIGIYGCGFMGHKLADILLARNLSKIVFLVSDQVTETIDSHSHLPVVSPIRFFSEKNPGGGGGGRCLYLKKIKNL
jgi:hypothetical protein